MPPQFVDTGGASAKVWPGGIVALRCADFIAPGNTTASTESDSRSICGTVVREPQQTSDFIWTNPLTAHDEAQFTLQFTLADLPVEDDMVYGLFISVLIEGDWDPTEPHSNGSGATQSVLGSTCALGVRQTDVPSVDVNDYSMMFNYYRNLSYYRIVAINAMPRSGGIVKADDIWYLKAYSSPGTTTNFLLDQIWLFPYVYSTTRRGNGQWNSFDFEAVPGDIGEFQGTTLVDGADGGDANGKFTWHPESGIEPAGVDPLEVFGWAGGGDYQQKTDASSAEDFFKIDAINDFEGPIFDSRTQNIWDDGGVPKECKVDAYSILGYQYEDWTVTDSFSRTSTIAGIGYPTPGGGWHENPEGFGWVHLTARFSAQNDPRQQVGVDGSRGVFRNDYSGASPTTVIGGSCWSDMYTKGTSGSPPNDFLSPSVAAEDFSFKAEYPRPTGFPGDTNLLHVEHYLDYTHTGSFFNQTYIVTYDFLSDTWTFTWGGGTLASGSLSGPSSVGIRIEIRRFKLRVRVWDASSSEPSTWDYDDFRLGFPGPLTYPYGDDPQFASEQQQLARCAVLMEFGTANLGSVCVVDMYIDNVEFKHDPGGSTIGDVTQWVSSPDATATTPAQKTLAGGDAWQMIYWGQDDWTAPDTPFGGTNFLIEMESKLWNAPGSPELQRAESAGWWFRTIHTGNPQIIRYR